MNTRYILISVESNSFGDQLIHIYDSKNKENLTISNCEGTWENPILAVEYLNKNTK